MKKKDFLLIASILAVGIAAMILLQFTREDGAKVIVRVDGAYLEEYSLYDDGEYILNGGTNILCIEGGCAYLKNANCPDLLCVKQGKISKTGQTITCLPNKLTVTVYGAKQKAPELIS